MEYLPAYILICAFIADWAFGDPKGLPHLIVAYGRLISGLETRFNNGSQGSSKHAFPTQAFLKGALLCIFLVALAFSLPAILLFTLLKMELIAAYFVLSTLLLFYCLANRTLINEGRKVFKVLEQDGLDTGRSQVARIVGRDTSELTENEVRAAALETVSENLSDGVIAPLFYYLLLGVPGAMAYKMINTLDSMIGYNNKKYAEFGRFSARLDDVANYIPSRLTAVLMLLTQIKPQGLLWVIKQAGKHKSPNAGYPEAALAFILDCRFGGPSSYQGELQEKEFIGLNQRPFVYYDMQKAISINLWVSVLFLVLSVTLLCLFMPGYTHA